jgi:hypothetical protein
MINFTGSHFEREIILWGVRWYVASPISYRQLKKIMSQRSVAVALMEWTAPSPITASQWARMGTPLQ